ncbi:hypothetical protein DL96DRAFT_1581240 [Flagelloscypha sp. PMI_526]|nr:hypothetical protein DL96DRAFT_1581240 [Flagelloscypha sp. PMI_526]
MSLPLDLLPNIMGSLDITDLESCSLVAASFRKIARPLLFAHVTLCNGTWKPKCTFLLSDPGVVYHRHVKKLSLQIDGMPSLDMDEEIPLSLTSVLEMLAPYLEAFCLHSTVDFGWEKLNSSFLDVIIRVIMPRIRSLELLRIMQIPVLTTLKNCPHLQHLHLSATDYIIGKPENYVEIKDLYDWNLPKATSIEIDVFGEEDFGDVSSLQPYIRYAGAKIRAFKLGKSCNRHFPLSWDFLRPFEEMRNSIHHLSFGSHLFSTVVEHCSTDSYVTLDLDMFSHLHSITFEVSSDSNPIDWPLWFGCLAQSFQHPQHSMLTTLMFTLSDSSAPDFGPTLNPFNSLAEQCGFEVRFVLRSCGHGESFAEIVSAFRQALPSWETAGRLDFWLKD